jgi:uridine kinase
MAYIIAVAAPIGGGKTSLVKALEKALQEAVTVHFDHYEKLSERPVDHLLEWMEKGADFNDFRVPGLAEDLDKLKRGESIVNPLTKEDISPEKYVVFEMPLGREHGETAKYIDLLLWVDIPLDMALARKLKEFTRAFLERYDPQKQQDYILWLDSYLDNYHRVVGKVLRIQETKVRAGADIIIDGTGDLETMIQQAMDAIPEKTAGWVKE